MPKNLFLLAQFADNSTSKRWQKFLAAIHRWHKKDS